MQLLKHVFAYLLTSMTLIYSICCITIWIKELHQHAQHTSIAHHDLVITLRIQAGKHVTCTRAVFTSFFNSSLNPWIGNSKAFVLKGNLIQSFNAKLENETL